MDLAMLWMQIAAQSTRLAPEVLGCNIGGGAAIMWSSHQTCHREESVPGQLTGQRC